MIMISYIIQGSGGQVPLELSKFFTYNIVHWYVLYGVDEVVVW